MLQWLVCSSRDVARHRHINEEVVDKVLTATKFDYKLFPFNIDVVVSSSTNNQVPLEPAPVTPKLRALGSIGFASTRRCFDECMRTKPNVLPGIAGESDEADSQDASSSTSEAYGS